MNKIVLDIETIDLFDKVKKQPVDLTISIVGVYYYNTDEYKTYTLENLNELQEELVNTDTIIGFNSLHFDIPLLQKYMEIDLKTLKHIDLLDEIKKSLGRRIKLDWVAQATLGIGKTGVGTDAVKLWALGEKEKVKEYCINDVKITKEVYEYAEKNKKLHYKELGIKKDIPIDTNTWEELKTNPVKSMCLF